MAKKHGAAIILSIFGTIGSCAPISAWAAAPIPSLMATAPQPSWSELTVEQKIVLAPLSDDWDSLESYRQKKWLSIAARFASMSALEQGRIQSQMQTWGKLAPDERELARRNFLTANQLPSEEKQALRQKWLEYSQLPADEKDKLMQQVAGKSVARRRPSPSLASPIPLFPPELNNRLRPVLPEMSMASALSAPFARFISAPNPSSSWSSFQALSPNSSPGQTNGLPAE